MDEIVEWPFAAGKSQVVRPLTGRQDTAISNEKFEFSAGEVPWPVAKEASKTGPALESMTATSAPGEDPQIERACGQGLE